MGNTDKEWRSPFGFNTVALRNEDERVGDSGPDSICGQREAYMEQDVFEILDGLVKEKDKVMNIFCFD
ncbi:MAG: hypothetical protein HQK88_15650 [Nitrospirae bacterium]|nr:hypothetical protein [Nitrospirota bacterium]MBF0536274.1 hypothetical protein [Nitrospirota bacterium]MBF0618236.1 hypothetical protein [Nitrospirota bacterium]